MKRLYEWAKEMFFKYRSIILYLIFGGITTAVNIVTYWLCFNVLSVPNLISNAVAWIMAVAAAYISNKLWVFESRSWQPGVVIPEVCKFLGARIATGILDEGIMGLGVDILHFNGLMVKLVSNVLVVILNYIFSRFIIFKKAGKSARHPDDTEKDRNGVRHPGDTE